MKKVIFLLSLIAFGQLSIADIQFNDATETVSTIPAMANIDQKKYNEYFFQIIKMVNNYCYLHGFTPESYHYNDKAKSDVRLMINTYLITLNNPTADRLLTDLIKLAVLGPTIN